MWGRQPGFPTLIQIILEQQVSLAAARSMYRRFICYLGAMTPEAVFVITIEWIEGLRIDQAEIRQLFRCFQGGLISSRKSHFGDSKN